MRVSQELSVVGFEDGHAREVTLTEGTTHGFASRPNVGYPSSEQAFEAVKVDVGAFFARHLVGP